MSNFLDLKLKDDSEVTLNNAVIHLATMLLHYSKAFDYDNASYADAKVVALGILTEAKELCEDEGCPQAGAVHVCVTRRPPPCPGCGRVPFGEEPCPTVGCLEAFVSRASVPMAEAIIKEINRPEGVKLTDGSYERGDGSVCFDNPDTAPKGWGQ